MLLSSSQDLILKARFMELINQFGRFKAGIYEEKGTIVLVEELASYLF